jgi:diguanylate cyclase (GGDEF)-like protein/PAS domain S-box-containing protein
MNIMKNSWKYIKLALLIFFILSLFNGLRIYHEYSNYQAFEYHAKKRQLDIIKTDMQKVSDSIFDNIINQPAILKLFSDAHKSPLAHQATIRQALYKALEAPYKQFTKYDIQQLHFHLPNNDSFLRFHKPKKFGDNLSQVRASVVYVNQYKKPTVGFEEGKIFNGYRFVYPLFYNDEHIGSVEISSSLLSFKKIYEHNNHLHLDFILKKSLVEKKLFKNQLKNYAPYHHLNDFVIQTTLKNYNDHEDQMIEIKHKEVLVSILDDHSIKTIQHHAFSKVLGTQLYVLDLIPLYNDFTSEAVGYAVIVAPSHYLDYFLSSIIYSFLAIIVLTLLFTAVFYLDRRHVEVFKERLAITEQNSRLSSSNQLFSSVMNGTDDLIFYKDKELKYIGCNDAFVQYIGKDRSEILGKVDSDLYDEERAKQVREFDQMTLEDDQMQIRHGWVTYTDGRRVYLSTKKTPFVYNNMGDVGILGVSRDLTDLHIAHKKIKEQTFIDELTKVHNRKAYNRRIDELLAHFERYNTMFSMIIFDIDHFKQVNDTYGHKTGDNVLIDLSQLVQRSIRKNDYFFRVGGEEFIVLLTHTELSDAMIIAEKLCLVVENDLRTLKDKKITISLGVTEVQTGDVEDSIFNRADAQLYQAKEGGRNRVVSSL